MIHTTQQDTEREESKIVPAASAPTPKRRTGSNGADRNAGAAMYPELHGLLRAVAEFSCSTTAPIAKLIESREHDELRGVEVTAPFKGYVITHGSRRDAAVIDIFAQEDRSGILEPVVYGLFPFVPCAVRVIAGYAELGVTDVRLANAVTLPPFAAKSLLTPGSVIEIVNPHTRVLFKPHVDLVCEIVSPIIDFPSLVGRKLSIRKYERLIKTLRSR